VAVIEAASAAAARGDFKAAFELLAAADADGTLASGDLPLFADMAYAAGRLDVVFATWERLHAERARAGERLGAAEAAVKMAQYFLIDTALMAPGRAWLARADALLAGDEDNPVFAWLALIRNYVFLLSGDFESSRQWARRALEVGTRFEPVAAAFAKVAEARRLILEGNAREGVHLLDEAAGATFGADLPVIPAGMIYCELVCGAQGVGQYDLAEQWTEAYGRWSSRAQGSLGGRCRVHRAEILRLRGALAEAEAEAMAACEELRPFLRRELGWPFTELGMIRLRRGDLAGAEEAFVAAHEVSWDPHPGFALVCLAQGEIKRAREAIRDALDHPMMVPSKERPPSTDLRRVPLLDAQVEIDVVAGDVESARAAAAELASLAERFESKAFAASAALARGRVELAGGDVARARPLIERAVQLWTEVNAPYETAVARSVLAAALSASGQVDRARLEQRAAETALERIGAHHVVPEPIPASSMPPASSARTVPPPPAPSCVFRREGDIWITTFEGETARMRDLKGMQYLARLFAEPGREIHVLDLVGNADPELPPSSLGDAGTLLDARAKEMYRRRLSEIDEDIETARRNNDAGSVTQAERERDFLMRELSRAVGLGGRDRMAGSASERARCAATRAVRQAIARMREHHTALAEHLDRTVRTGTFFLYQPDPRAPVDWQL
jgi:tetratricopeptide (TPR) repeat protein